MRERATIAPAEVLYHSRRDDAHHRVYTHRSEEAMLVTNNQEDRAFIMEESYDQLQRSHMQYIHLGILQVRVQTLHRQEEGTLALLVFRDNRWTDDRSIIATMEVDLTRGSQLVYVIPDIMMTIRDFFHNIQLSILARGYDTWRDGEANLLITRGMVGRLSNTPNVAFAHEISGVVDYLTSHGVRALPGRRYSTAELRGRDWVIRPTQIMVPMQPAEIRSRNLIDGRISISFDTYKAASTSSRINYNNADDEALSDEEEIRNHTIAVSIQLSDDSEDEANELRQYLNSYQEVDVSEDGRELPYPQKYQKEVVAAGLEEDLEMEYPHRARLSQRVYALSAVSNYRPPTDSTMGPANYPPAVNIESTSQKPAYEGYSRQPRFKSKDLSEAWNLPSAFQQQGAMFIIPSQLGMFEEVFMRWESITKNLVSLQGFTDPQAKMEFIENLLGEAEKLAWIQWRMAYPEEYQLLMANADGSGGTQNILSQLRTIFILEDPFQGSTTAQEEAYRDLERLSCTNLKHIIQFLNDYMRLASKTGRLFTSPELSEKLWSKMPGELGKRIKEAFETKYRGNTIGVIPRVLFSYKYLEAECKDAAFRRALKDLSFCSEIPIPGYYNKPERRYGVRRSTTYKGKPHSSHARIEKRKHLIRNKKCKCYLCGEEGHFARECPNDRKNIKRVAMFEQLDLPDDYEILSVQEGENQSDAIYSISEGEDVESLQHGIHSFTHRIFALIEDSRTWWIGPDTGYRARVQVSQTQAECKHIWEINTELPASMEICNCCKRTSQRRHRRHCPLCEITSCGMCSIYYFNKRTPVMTEEPPRYEPKNLLQQQQDYINHCEAEIRRLKMAVESEQQKAKELEEIQIQAIATAQENLRLQHEICEWKKRYDQLEGEAMEIDRLRLEKADLLKEMQKLRTKEAEESEENVCPTGRRNTEGFIYRNKGNRRIQKSQKHALQPRGTN